jgi:uncharacterized MnhB-related membrane protein
MSLRAFHLFFIGMSVVLAAFVAAWAGQQYQALHAAVYAVTGAASLASGLALAFYAVAFQRKTRKL